MIVLAVVVALLIAFNLMRIGVEGGYDGNGPLLKVRAGPVRLTILPKTHKEKPKKQKKKKREKTAGKTDKQRKKPDAEHILTLAKLGLRAVKRFLRGLRVDILRLHYTVACEDPADTGQQYGMISSAVDALEPFMTNVLKIRERDVRIGFSFEDTKPQIEAYVSLTIRIWQIFAAAFGFGFAYADWRIKQKFRQLRESRAERKENHGEQ